ncbi:MAG: GxxExxY protein [Prosthecobacter sp.]|nr:GxxExxY protein [Prosthecobacter sp.]
MISADLPHMVIGACMNVHGALGPGLTREVYEECLAAELRGLEIPFERGKPLQFEYRGHQLSAAARLDFVVEGALVLLVQAGEETSALDKHKMETYLRLSGIRAGLLVNFNVSVLRKGIQRVTMKRMEKSP